MCEPGEEVALSDRFVIGDVITWAESGSGQGGDDGPNEILEVDHVQEAVAVSMDFGFAAKELVKEMAAIGAVDSSDAEDRGDGERVEEFFGLDQHRAGGAGRMGGAGFVDEGTVRLRIDAGAAGVEEALWIGGLQPGEKIFGAAEIDLLVFIDSAAGGGDEIDDPIEGWSDSGEARRICDVRVNWRDAGGVEFMVGLGGAAEPGDMMAEGDQLAPEREADVTATDDENAHGSALDIGELSAVIEVLAEALEFGF